MSSQSVTRRDILQTLAMGAVGGSVLQVIPAKAAEFVHQAVRKEKAADNPWGAGATTLEWTLPSPPPFHQYNELPLIR